MRGRKPHLIVLSEKDRTQFQKTVRDGRTEQLLKAKFGVHHKYFQSSNHNVEFF